MLFIAKAIKGEKDKCLALGMNGFLSKPLERNKLDFILEKYLAPKGDNLKKYINESVLAQFDELQIDGKADILIESIQSFLSTSKSQIEALKVAAKQFNWVDCGKRAHSIKSSAFLLGAKILGDQCQEIEDLCKNNCNEIQMTKLMKGLLKYYKHSCAELMEIKNTREDKIMKKAG